MSQAPQQIRDTISKFSKFYGKRQAPQRFKDKRGIHLHKFDWELLKSEKKIQWIYSLKKWIPYENTE